MPFGSWLAYRNLKRRGVNSKLWGLYFKLFGIPELHNPIRFRVLKHYFQPKQYNLEVGAGGLATMSIGFFLITRRPILALVYTEEDRKSVEETTESIGLSRPVTVKCEDALKLNTIGYDRWEQVLLLDVLEHVRGSDIEVLRNINRLLRPEGYLIISVPTPVYPKYFSEKFDKFAWNAKPREAKITTHHLRHYTINQLEKILTETGFKILDWQYHTNPFAAQLCRIWYKYLYRCPRLRCILFPILNMLSIFDQFSPIRKRREPLKSAGIALLATKRMSV